MNNTTTLLRYCGETAAAVKIFWVNTLEGRRYLLNVNGEDTKPLYRTVVAAKVAALAAARLKAAHLSRGEK